MPDHIRHDEAELRNKAFYQNIVATNAAPSSSNQLGKIVMHPRSFYIFSYASVSLTQSKLPAIMRKEKLGVKHKNNTIYGIIWNSLI
jgi:hypothetical protein